MIVQGDRREPDRFETARTPHVGEWRDGTVISLGNDAFLEAKEKKADEHHMFVYDVFVKNRRSVIVTVYQILCVYLNIYRQGAVPGRDTILIWVHILQ